jgi:UDP-glucose 4,6-dehydratase
MSRFLLTGCYGFIGSEVANRIFEEFPFAQKLVILDRIDYNSRPENVEKSVRDDPRFLFVKGDLCSVDLMSFILKEYQIDTVIHLAAQTHVDESFKNSLQFTRDNVLGTHSLVEACRAYNKIEKFIHMSTDEVYGEAEDNSHHEGCLLNPTNPYAATKAAAEFILKSYGHSYKFPYIIIRGNNVYGHGQYPDKLIPKFSLYLKYKRKLPIHGEGGAKRMFVHVNDMARGILLVAKKGILGETYNIGSRNEFTVLEIAKAICESFGKDPVDVINYVQDRYYNDKRYYIDYSKIKELGWKEQVSFEDGLNETIQWYIDRADEFVDRI